MVGAVKSMVEKPNHKWTEREDHDFGVTRIQTALLSISLC